MTTALYLEHYLDSLEQLPIELQRNFTLMRDLDARAQTLMKNIDHNANTLLESLRGPKPIGTEKRKEQISSIQKLFNKAKEYGDDKVQLAIQTYELVDKHIRRLDSDLARFESEIQDKAAAGGSRSNDDSTLKNRNKKTKEKDKKKRGITAITSAGGSSEEELNATSTGKGRKKQKRGGSKAQATKNTEVVVTTPLSSLIGAHPTDVLDMPVDPNEPTYCLCHQVSYGEMIGCDNSDCPIEWFHFACVGLVTKPKGKWYCPKCTADRKKK